MTPDEAIVEAREGQLRPVYLLLGEEGYLQRDVVDAIRAAVDLGPAAGFNEDRLIASDTSADRVVAAAQTAPMMARQRYVLLSGLDRWEKKGDEELERLATYAADPAPFSVLVLCAPKLNASRKLVRAAKKDGFLVTCAPLGRRELPSWIQRKARQLGHELEAGLHEVLAEIAGPELGNVADALERLSLYVGKSDGTKGGGAKGNVIDEAALVAVVTRVRQETVWALVDALAERNLSGALGALRDAYDARDSGLPLLGTIAWRTRQLVKFQAELSRGEPASEAARVAGVAPFKARDIERVVRRLPPSALERWLLLLAEADLALKGSRRGGSEVLAAMLVDMCS